MIKFILGPIIIAIISIIGISFYLQLDDMSVCGQSPSDLANCKSVDAIVVVSGGNTDSRTNEAIELYKNGWAKKLVFSGAAQDKTGPSNAAAMKITAVSAGVPESAIFLEEYATTTKQNAVNSQDIFLEQKISSIILVTSGYHQRRASLEFNKHTENIKIINHPTKTDPDWSNLWWTNPRGWWLATNEIAKIVVFYIEGIWS